MSSKIAKEIFEYALEHVKPRSFMKRRCTLNGEVLKIDESSYNLGKYKNIVTNHPLKSRKELQNSL